MLSLRGIVHLVAAAASAVAGVSVVDLSADLAEDAAVASADWQQGDIMRIINLLSNGGEYRHSNPDSSLFGARLDNGDLPPEELAVRGILTAEEEKQAHAALHLHSRLQLQVTADPSRPDSKTCFDYTVAFDIGRKECNFHYIYQQIYARYIDQSKEDWAQNSYCRGGIFQELRTLTGATEPQDWPVAIQEMCDSAFKDEAAKLPTNDWGKIQNAGVDLEEYFRGVGFLNTELGNFQQKEIEFTRRGGHKQFNYVGNDPRMNDYLATTERSYQAGQAVKSFSDKEMKKSFLEFPPAGGLFDDGCEETNTIMCCWRRDRQYFDNNGSCRDRNCVLRNPRDNTDVCWTEEDGEAYAYPAEGIEGDINCHGLIWPDGADYQDDLNSKAKYNNLFYVSMYGHMFERGYVGSVTTTEPRMYGDQPMCGCVEDMNPVARAGCRQVVGRANYTAHQNYETGRLVLEVVPDTFSLKFQSCKGYDYKADVTPETYRDQFKFNAASAQLDRRNNDLSAFMFRQYIEGKMPQSKIDKYEETVIGYKDLRAQNNGDQGRAQACEAAWNAKYSGKPYVEAAEKPADDETVDPNPNPWGPPGGRTSVK